MKWYRKLSKRPRVKHTRSGYNPGAIRDEGLQQKWCLTAGIFCGLTALLMSYAYTGDWVSRLVYKEYIIILGCYIAQCWNSDGWLCKICAVVSTVSLVWIFIYSVLRILHRDFMVV